MTDFNMLLVSGSRTIDDMVFVWKCIDETYKRYKFDTIVEGGADGVDSFAGLYAVHHKFNHLTMYPNWSKYGNRAGVIRNTEMVEIANKGIAIWDGKSTGTKDTIKKMKKAGILIKVFKYEEKKTD